MKLNKQIITALVIMVAMSALYRVLPGRPLGFAPQIAIALFGGSLLASKKQYAFLLPLVSMFLLVIIDSILVYVEALMMALQLTPITAKAMVG